MGFSTPMMWVFVVVVVAICGFFELSDVGLCCGGCCDLWLFMDFLFWVFDACGCDCGFFVVICLKDLWWAVDCCGWRMWWLVFCSFVLFYVTPNTQCRIFSRAFFRM